MIRKNRFFEIPGAIIIEGHVQGLSNTRSLGAAGIPVYVVDKNDCIARYSKYCTRFFKCPDFILDDFVYFLIDLAKNEKISGWVLIPSNDHAVYTISRHKPQLEDYFKVITPGLDIIKTIYDKTELIRIARDINISIPTTQLFKSKNDPIIAELHFPVITKGRNGLSFYKAIGKKALIAYNAKQLREQLESLENKYPVKGTFTQEYIPFNGNNYTISFTAFCDNGEIKAHWSGIKIREHPVRFGTATFAKSIINDTCLRNSAVLLRKINYTGVCEVEYLEDPRSGEFKLIEINPRTWLWVGLARECGVDYVKMIYDFVNNHPIESMSLETTERYWINPITDCVFSLISIFKGNLKPKRYISSWFIKGKVNALFEKGDRIPGWIYIIKLAAFYSQR